MRHFRYTGFVFFILIGGGLLVTPSTQAEKLLITSGGTNTLPELIQLPDGVILPYYQTQRLLPTIRHSVGEFLVRDMLDQATYVYTEINSNFIDGFPLDLVYLASRDSLSFRPARDLLPADTSLRTYLVTPGNLLYYSTEMFATVQSGYTDETTDIDQDHAADILDCQPQDPLIFPGATETIEDGIDQDCNGADTIRCYLDGDGDEYPYEELTLLLADDGQCNWQQGEMVWSDTPAAADCDDSNANVNPGQTESMDCDGIDNNCNGDTDEGLENNWYADIDEDNYGDPGNQQQQACSITQLSGYVSDSTDCDDLDALAHPGQSWYQDADDDGYPEGSAELSCLQPGSRKAGEELQSLQQDNCPADANPLQIDLDGDEKGMACDSEIMLANDDTADGATALSKTVASGVERLVEGILTGEHLSDIPGLHISTGSVSYLFTPQLTTLNILAADFSGNTLLRAYDSNGALIATLSISSSNPEPYTLHPASPIAKITLSSSAGWFGPMSYTVKDDDFLLMIIPAIISAIRE